MIQVRRPPLKPKKGGSRREEMSTIPVKNTLLHLNVQNLALGAKNRGHFKAPGPHLSPVPVKEAAGRLTTSPLLTQEGTARLDSLLARSHKPVLAKGTENYPVRRPLKLAPLVLSEDVRQAQKQKLKCSQDVNNVKTCASHSREKTCLIAVKKPPVKSMKDVVCQGTPAPLFPKLAPNSPHMKGRSKVSTDPNPTNQDSTSKRRLRLTRGQCLEGYGAKPNVSTTTTVLALCPDGDKLVKGVRSKGQRQDRGNPQSGKGIREFPGVPQEKASVKKSSGEERMFRSDTGASKSPGDGPSEPEGEKTSGSSWRVRKKKALMTKHNQMVTLERLQL